MKYIIMDNKFIFHLDHTLKKIIRNPLYEISKTENAQEIRGRFQLENKLANQIPFSIDQNLSSHLRVIIFF